MSRHIVASPDTKRTTPITIEAFMHCQNCLNIRPPGVSPAEWSRLDVGFTQTGDIQVACRRCQLNVLVLHHVIVNEGEDAT